MDFERFRQITKFFKSSNLNTKDIKKNSGLILLSTMPKIIVSLYDAEKSILLLLPF
jgi:hypothetical protein